MSEISTHFLFTQKIYKDCTALTLHHDALQAQAPQIVSQEVAVNQEFLANLLIFLKKICKNLIKEDHNHQLTNAIYSISTIMNAILKIIDHRPDAHVLLFTMANQIHVLDVLSLLLPKSHSFVNDFSITERLLRFLTTHLDWMIAQTPLQHFKDEVLTPVTLSEQAALVQTTIKLLC